MEEPTTVQASHPPQPERTDGDLSPQEAERLFEQVNQMHRAAVLNLDPSEACLFLPHCLRSRDCAGRPGEEGLECARCGRCVIAGLLDAAESLGLRVFCVPGGSLVEKLARRYRPRALLGVACSKEILLALRTFGSSGVHLLVFPLSRDGCFETGFEPQGLLSFLSEWQRNRTRSA
jgi:hypothetical protein